MHRAEFRTERPLDDLPRVLDVMRKLSFSLSAATLTAATGGPARVSITFEPGGSLSVETFIALVRRLPGIEELVHVPPQAERPRVAEMAFA
jgi:hypothetical protein